MKKFQKTPKHHTNSFFSRQTAKIGDACGLLIDKMRLLKVRKVEMGALLGIKMLNECEFRFLEKRGAKKAFKMFLTPYFSVSFLSSSINSHADKERRNIYMDLFSDIEEKYGIPKAGPRFGSLLMLLNDLDVSCWDRN